MKNKKHNDIEAETLLSASKVSCWFSFNQNNHLYCPCFLIMNHYLYLDKQIFEDFFRCFVPTSRFINIVDLVCFTGFSTLMLSQW